MLLLFPVFILPSMQSPINSNEHDHEDDLQSSYIPCDCGNPGCTGIMNSCPWMGGRPSPAPILYQPLSPDVDGIIYLYWSSSYGATSYKVYRSDAEFGTYTLRVTTSSLSYTDTTTDGTWWYYVRAYNSNGYRPSSKVSVEVYLPPEPVILLGSIQRFFPHENTAKLGFTIYTEFANGVPRIDLAVTETATCSYNVNLMVKIDNTLVFVGSGNFYSTEEFFNIGGSLLQSEGTHQILIELTNGDGPNLLIILIIH